MNENPSSLHAINVHTFCYNYKGVEEVIKIKATSEEEAKNTINNLTYFGQAVIDVDH